MIDLRKKGLPDRIQVAGKSYLLYTDFREWIEFGNRLQEDRCSITDLAFVVKDLTLLELLENPKDFYEELYKFYCNPNLTPKAIESEDSEILIDYIQDGEYIVGSFMSEYHIDLTECDMHWHMFKALFQSLSEDSKIKQIMNMRGYRKNNTSYESQCRKLKEMWRLPQYSNTVDKSILDDINNEFYNC